MRKKTIILVGMSSVADWEHGILNKKFQQIQTGAVNRNFHVLQTLLKRPDVDRVITVDFLPFTWKKVAKEIIQARLWARKKNTIQWGMGWRLDQITEKWWSLACLRAKDIKHLDQFIHLDSELIIWSYHPFFPEVFNTFTQSKKVFDTVDNWAEHPSYKKFKHRLKKNYQLINQKADTIFTVSPNLLDLFPGHTNAHWVPNGVDTEHFSHPQHVQHFSLLRQPFAVYVGIIQERLDIPLLAEVANLLPQVFFVLAGPIWEGVDVSSLEHLPNVKFIGPIPYTELPNLLNKASCGIIPHRVNTFTASMNPLKLYEYLASGLPVVSTPVKGTEQFSTGVLLADNAKTFAKQILHSLDFSDSEKAALRLLVKDQTWEDRIKSMCNYILE